MLFFHAVLCKHITLIAIATSHTFQFFGFYSYLPPLDQVSLLQPGLEQLLKYQLGVWVAPTTNLACELQAVLFWFRDSRFS